MAKRVMVGGSFDIIHLGHINFLKAAKNLCENCKLIVIVSRDSTIKRIKGREPVFSENDRLEIVKSIKYVDEAYLGNELEEKSFFDIILEIKPDIIALGYDQNINEDKLKKWCEQKGLSIKIVRLPKFSSGRINSSTEARNRVLQILTRNKS